METRKKKKITTEKVVITGAGLAGASLLAPFLEEFLGEKLQECGFTGTGIAALDNASSVKSYLFRMAVGAASKRAAGALVKHPEMLTEWGRSVIDNSWRALAHYTEPLTEAVSGTLETVQSIITDHAVDAATSAGDAVADAAGEALIDVGGESVAEAVADAAGEAAKETVGEVVADILGRFFVS